MLRTRKRTLTVVGGGWAHPYRTGPFDPFLYADGGDGGGSGSGSDGGGDNDGSGNGDGGGDDDEDKLGEAGKKAIKAERDARQAAEARVKELEARLTRKPKDPGAKPEGDEGKGGQGGQGAKPADAEAIKKEIRDELTAESNVRLARAEIKAAAAGKLADPADAPRYIDPTTIKVGDDGEPDAKQIKKAIADLLKERPYLAGRQPWGDVGGGGHDAPPADVKPGMARLRHAYATENKTK